jgi:ferrous iron transport protein B
MAYVTATLFYQGLTYQHHPLASLAWWLGLILLFAVIIFSFRQLGHKQIHGIQS